VAENNSKGWQLNRQINISVLIQLFFLAFLIVGSYVNLQRQLDLLQRDVTMLLESQKNFQEKLESLSAKSVEYEYRLRALENQSSDGSIALSQKWPETRNSGHR
jgi:hypothetical protein